MLDTAHGAWTIRLIAAAAGATVAPLSPEGRVMMDRKDALENAVRRRFDDGMFNRVRDMHGSIIVASQTRTGAAPPRVLIKDEHGWFELRSSGRVPLPAQLASELTRLMVQPALWSESPYGAALTCRTPRTFVLRYNGHEQFGRQCRASGLAGRVAEAAATLRVPPDRGATTAPPAPAHDPRPGSGAG